MDQGSIEALFGRGIAYPPGSDFDQQKIVAARAAQVMTVLAGCGIAQLPTWLIKQQLADGSLVQVLPHLASEGLAINLVWPKSRQALPKVSALLDALAAGLMPLDG